MNHLSSTNKDGKDQNEEPLQVKELVAKDLKSFTYNKLHCFGNSTQLDYYVYVNRGWINKQAHFPSEDNTRLPVAVKRLDHFKCVDRVKHLVLYPFYLNITDMKIQIYFHSSTTHMVVLHMFLSRN